MRLIRDGISVTAVGTRSVADEDELDRLLRRKLLEEVAGFLEAPNEQEAIEEAADVLEVLLTMLRRSDVVDPLNAVTAVMRVKRHDRGGFLRGMVLEIS